VKIIAILSFFLLVIIPFNKTYADGDPDYHPNFSTAKRLFGNDGTSPTPDQYLAARLNALTSSVHGREIIVSAVSGAALKAAFDQANSDLTINTIHIPTGVYFVSKDERPTITRNDLRVIGAGTDQTRIVSNYSSYRSVGDNGTLRLQNSCTKIIIRDLTLENQWLNASDPGMVLTDNYTPCEAMFWRVRFVTPSKDTIWLTGGSYVFFGCWIEGKYDVLSSYADWNFVVNTSYKVYQGGQALNWLGGGNNQYLMVKDCLFEIQPGNTNYLSLSAGDTTKELDLVNQELGPLKGEVYPNGYQSSITVTHRKTDISQLAKVLKWLEYK